MFKEIVEVAEVTKEGVRVKFEKEKTCSCCSLSSLCRKGEAVIPDAASEIALRKGDKVEVAIPAKQMLFSISMLFLVPIVIFIISLLLFQKQGELGSFFYALLAIVFYYVAAKIFLRFSGKQTDITVLRKI